MTAPESETSSAAAQRGPPAAALIPKQRPKTYSRGDCSASTSRRLGHASERIVAPELWNEKRYDPDAEHGRVVRDDVAATVRDFLVVEAHPSVVGGKRRRLRRIVAVARIGDRFGKFVEREERDRRRVRQGPVSLGERERVVQSPCNLNDPVVGKLGVCRRERDRKSTRLNSSHVEI